MTLTDSSKEDRELEDCVATDQATADQKQNAMDLDAPIAGLADNANGTTEEANFGASGVEGELALTALCAEFRQLQKYFWSGMGSHREHPLSLEKLARLA